FYIFKTFSHNYLQLMAHSWGKSWTPQHAKAFAYLALSPAVVAGGGTIIGKELFIQLAKALGIGGDDPEEETYKWIGDTFGEAPETFSRYGVAGLAGVSLKGSLQIGITDLPSSIGDLLGAPGAMLYKDPMMMMKAINRGAWSKAFEKAPIMPLFLANPIKAAREYTEGVTTWGNYPVYYKDKPLVADATDAVMRALSFNPIGIAKPTETQYKESKLTKSYNAEKEDIYALYRKMLLSKKAASMMDWMELLSNIQQFNNRIGAAGLDRRGLVQPITDKSLKTITTKFYQPPMVERLRSINE
ncbi:MAG: hypothetical protein HQK77_14155, partial [Desulfobacterales bacterium]|nr:hypothetical protein [Desulfobacterales bacterium]